MRWFVALLVLAVAVGASLTPAQAQIGFDRPGGDYFRFTISSGDPAACAARCDREGRCRAWAFSYPGSGSSPGAGNASCWLKGRVTAAVEASCCVSGVKGAGLVEARPGPVEVSIDRYGGDYRSFELPSDPTGMACKQACEGDKRCRAWTYSRPGYGNGGARCFLKERVTRPRRKPCCMSGVVR